MVRWDEHFLASRSCFAKIALAEKSDLRQSSCCRLNILALHAFVKFWSPRLHRQMFDTCTIGMVVDGEFPDRVTFRRIEVEMTCVVLCNVPAPPLVNLLQG